MKDAFKKLLNRFKLPQLIRRNCSVCAGLGINFLPLPDFYKNEATKHGYKYFGQGEMTALKTYSCSQCGASDRERFYAYWIDMQIQEGGFKKGAKVIHFAPEAKLSEMLQNLNFFHNQTADFSMKDVDYKVDITKMPEVKTGSYDFFICSHVLEHVDNDDKAIQELYRILKDGGYGILMAPIIVGLENTIEDSSKVTEEERWQYFGQNDHVRLYAHDDYIKKLEINGFMVDQLGVEYFGKKVFKELGLKETSILYIVKKA